LLVMSGATLSGTGTVGTAGSNTTIQGGATLSPGAEYGSLKMAGNLVLLPSSLYQVQTDSAGQVSKTVVAGDALLGGKVLVEAKGANLVPRTQYVILQAEQVQQSFE